jgi:hypothetical protein
MLFAGRHLEISEPQNGQRFAISKNKQNPSEGGVLLEIGNEGAAFPGSNSRNRLAAISRIKNAIKDRKFVGKTSIPKMAIIASSQRRSNRASSCVPITDQKRQGGHDVALPPGCIHLRAGIHQCVDDGVGLRYRVAERLQWPDRVRGRALTAALHCCISLLIWSDAAGAASVSDRTDAVIRGPAASPLSLVARR